MKTVIAIFAILFLAACSRSSGGPVDGAEDPVNSSESAMAAIGGASSASEGATGPMFSLHSLTAASVCAFASRSACIAGVDTLSWADCGVSSLAWLTGGWTETWSPTGDCTAAVLASATDTVSRTTTNQTLSFFGGAVLKVDTIPHQSYDLTSIGSGVVVTMVTTASNSRTIAVAGIHKTFFGPHGKEWFDHSLITPGASVLNVTGTRAGNNRVASGNLTVYHNLAKYTAVHSFNTVTWGASTCCYPTSGNITSTLTGTVTGARTLDFTPGAVVCGAATFTDTDGSVTAKLLSMCE